MGMDEFQLISKFFQREYSNHQIICGSGDDAACLQPTPGHLLCVSTDTSVEGVHFLPEWDPYLVASKAITANISDIAAMAAVPKWVTVALTLPFVDQEWIKSFSQGMFKMLDANDVALVGGDITRGPLTITVAIFGECLHEDVTYRHGAKVGDIIYITAPLGAPALALEWLNEVGIDETAKKYLMNKLQKPLARTDCRQLISQFANSCIDISDGLVGDLGHICESSQVGANLEADLIPIDSVVKKQAPDSALSYALHGGDEYQLCFTVSPAKKNAVEELAKKQGLSIYAIGHIIQKKQINLVVNGIPSPLESHSYRHFS